MLTKTLTIAAIALTAAVAATPANAGGVWNGAKMNGVADNGARMNGGTYNGIFPNGRSVQGAATTGAVAPEASGMRVLTIELPDAR